MSTELAHIMDWYAVSLDCQQSMKKIINKNPEVIPQRSLLHEKSVTETFELIDRAIRELNDLTIIALVSVFEQNLIAEMRHILHGHIQSVDEMTVQIQKFVILKAERSRFEEIIDLFSPRVGKELCGLVKQVYRYRNEIAHPKESRKPNVKIDPYSAYERLTEFMNGIKEFT